MRSDIDAVAKTGGGSPRFQVVKVAGLSLGKAQTAGTTAPSTEGEVAAPGKSRMIVAIVVVVAIAALAFLGYLIYNTFFAGVGTARVQNTAVVPGQNQTQGQGNAAPAATGTVATVASPFIHTSLFKKQADQTLIFTLSSGGAAASAADLQTFSQKLSTLLAGANKGANVIEIVMRIADGHGVPIGNVLAQANAPFLNAQALAHFDPDATFFVYRNQVGLWPGIVLSLKPGDNWLFANNDVAQLESSSNIGNLFLQNVGQRSGSGFVDSTVSSTAVRTLSFPNADPPATFLYGWDQTYLILSTSPGGFMQAMNLLRSS